MSTYANFPRTLIDAVLSDAMTLGWFDAATSFEPKSAPSGLFHIAATVGSVTPLPRASGLISTSMRFEIGLRIYVSMLREPQDDIDGDITAAAWDLMSRYSSGFTLNGLIRNVDLLGETGEGLQLMFGYVEIDKKMFRIANLVVPMIVNDVFDQGA